MISLENIMEYNNRQKELKHYQYFNYPIYIHIYASNKRFYFIHTHRKNNNKQRENKIYNNIYVLYMWLTKCIIFH